MRHGIYAVANEKVNCPAGAACGRPWADGIIGPYGF